MQASDLLWDVLVAFNPKRKICARKDEKGEKAHRCELVILCLDRSRGLVRILLYDLRHLLFMSNPSSEHATR